MAHMVQGGADVMDAFAGGFPNQQTQQWLHAQSEQLRSISGHMASQFFDQAQSLYTVIDEMDAEQIRRNLREKNNALFGEQLIQPLTSLESIQTANPVMQRYIMAYPGLRERYFDQALDGYSDSYENIHGIAIGEEHRDYRFVMDAMVQAPVDEDYRSVEYIEPLADGEQDLTLGEKLDVLTTWSMVEHYLEEGDEDPTSVYGNKL